jgi:hypothetical protein
MILEGGYFVCNEQLVDGATMTHSQACGMSASAAQMPKRRLKHAKQWRNVREMGESE